MNKTILEIIHELFNAKENKDRDFTFNEITENVESILGEEWKKNNKKGLSKSILIENKTGEIYKLITVDGGFVRHEDGTWSKRKINEAS